MKELQQDPAPPPPAPPVPPSERQDHGIVASYIYHLARGTA
jgi:hypothetical protein